MKRHNFCGLFFTLKYQKGSALVKHFLEFENHIAHKQIITQTKTTHGRT